MHVFTEKVYFYRFISIPLFLEIETIIITIIYSDRSIRDKIIKGIKFIEILTPRPFLNTETK